MTAEDVIKMLEERGFIDLPLHPAFSSFAKEMRERNYGSGPLFSAWCWYRDGWMAAREPAGDGDWRAGSEWRVGRKVGRTIYYRDVLVGLVDTSDIAVAIANAMNRLPLNEAVVKVAWEAAGLGEWKHDWAAFERELRTVQQAAKTPEGDE